MSKSNGITALTKSLNGGVRGVSKMDAIIGNKLRARRLELHMSQSDLADALAISFQQIQKYEKGVNRIGSARLMQIANHLQVDVAYFLNDLQPDDSKRVKVSVFSDFLATPDGVAINEAMMKLGDAHRKSVIDLTRSLARAYAQ